MNTNERNIKVMMFGAGLFFGYLLPIAGLIMFTLMSIIVFIHPNTK